MALDKVTIFEFHFNGAQFGTRELLDMDAATVETAATEPKVEAEETWGRGRVLALVILSLGLSVVATAVARRLVGDGEQIEVQAVGGLELEQ